MKSFKDSKGRTWPISINVDTIKRVKSTLDVDLLKVVEGKLIDELLSNPILLCDVLFVVCREDLDKSGVDDSSFGSALAGDVLESATSVLLEDLVDFFPKAKRQVLQKALGKIKEMESKAMDAVTRQIDSPEFQSKIDQQLKAATG